ncbi:hypothetical protein FNF28_04791 [Cafeteria roenbergensis]|uniref:Phosphodiesterase n=1 Tax=Cafeteria roenbergensis TaxID=33653 RepID=A0A5A8DA32_CAFRO|nr:hypothetical protein FNF28_04791 [Cafeteria roenbergensis]
MKFIEILASYMPSIIVKDLLRDEVASEKAPRRVVLPTVVMFADVSGFTKLSEAMARHGPEGAEYLTRHLNSYFSQMVKSIASEGGDIFKFAGDAMIVLWPESAGTLEQRARHAVQCAESVQRALHEAKLEEGVTLSVKIGIGVGAVSILHLGGVLDRMEYVAVGDPLVQAFAAEEHCKAGGEVLVSPSVWALVKDFIRPLEVLKDGFARITEHGKGAPEGVFISRMPRKGKGGVGIELQLAGRAAEARLKQYTPGAIQTWISPDALELESWGGDLRNVSVLFVNLGLRNDDLLAAAKYREPMHRVHEVLRTVQSAVYRYEGSVNKFLMDDKGSTLIAVFGLPPISHHDDSTRAVLAALAICDGLWDLELQASVGVTTGVVFCGVVGSTTRKEYSVLGDTVNLSARLMQRAMTTGGGVIVDSQIVRATGSELEYADLGEISVKGKSNLIRIARPYPAASVREGLPLSSRPANYPGTEPKLFKTAFLRQCARPPAAAPPEAAGVADHPRAADFAIEIGERGRTWLLPVHGAAGRSLPLGLLPWLVSEAECASAAGMAAGSLPARVIQARDVNRRYSSHKRARMALLNARLALFGAGQGGCLVLEGDAGSGKTHLLARAVSQDFVGKTAVLALSADPFDRFQVLKPLAQAAGALLRGRVRWSRVRSGASLPASPRKAGRQAAASSDAAAAAAAAATSAAGPPGGATASAAPSGVSPLSIRAGSGPGAAGPATPMADLPGPAGTGDSRRSSNSAPRPRTLGDSDDEDDDATGSSSDPVSRAELTAACLAALVEAGVDAERVARGGAVLNSLLGVRLPKSQAASILNKPQPLDKERVALQAELLCAVIAAHCGSAVAACLSRADGPDAVGPGIAGAAANSFRREPSTASSAGGVPSSGGDSAATPATDRASTRGGGAGAGAGAGAGSGKSSHGSKPGPAPGAEPVTSQPLMLCIDDAQYLHPTTWEAISRLAARASRPAGSPGALPLLLVLATRPPQRYSDVIFRTVPPAFTDLVASPHCEHHLLGRLAPRDMRALTALALEWGGPIRRDVFDLVEARSGGQPAAAIELLRALVVRGRIVVLPEGHPSAAGAESPGVLSGYSQLVPALPDAIPKWRRRTRALALAAPLHLVRVPYLRRNHDALGAQADRLGPLPQLVLRTAAVIAHAARSRLYRRIAAVGAEAVDALAAEAAAAAGGGAGTGSRFAGAGAGSLLPPSARTSSSSSASSAVSSPVLGPSSSATTAPHPAAIARPTAGLSIRNARTLALAAVAGIDSAALAAREPPLSLAAAVADASSTAFDFGVLCEVFPFPAPREALIAECRRLVSLGFLREGASGSAAGRALALGSASATARDPAAAASALTAASAAAALTDSDRSADGSGNGVSHGGGGRAASLTPAVASTSTSVPFRFALPALAETVRLRLLDEQRAKILKRLDVAAEKRARSLAGRALVASLRRVERIVCAVRVRKAVNATGRVAMRSLRGEWKERLLALSADSIEMGKMPHGALAAPILDAGLPVPWASVPADVTQRVPMHAAEAAVPAADEITTDDQCVMRIRATQWEKKGVAVSDPKHFYLAMRSAPEREQVIFAVNFLAEKAREARQGPARKAHRSGGGGGVGSLMAGAAVGGRAARLGGGGVAARFGALGGIPGSSTAAAASRISGEAVPRMGIKDGGRGPTGDALQVVAESGSGLWRAHGGDDGPGGPVLECWVVRPLPRAAAVRALGPAELLKGETAGIDAGGAGSPEDEAAAGASSCPPTPSAASPGSASGWLVRQSSAPSGSPSAASGLHHGFGSGIGSPATPRNASGTVASAAAAAAASGLASARAALGAVAAEPAVSGHPFLGFRATGGGHRALLGAGLAVAGGDCPDVAWAAALSPSRRVRAAGARSACGIPLSPSQAAAGWLVIAVRREHPTAAADPPVGFAAVPLAALTPDVGRPEDDDDGTPPRDKDDGEDDEPVSPASTAAAAAQRAREAAAAAVLGVAAVGGHSSGPATLDAGMLSALLRRETGGEVCVPVAQSHGPGAAGRGAGGRANRVGSSGNLAARVSDEAVDLARPLGAEASASARMLVPRWVTVPRGLVESAAGGAAPAGAQGGAASGAAASVLDGDTSVVVVRSSATTAWVSATTGDVRALPLEHGGAASVLDWAVARAMLQVSASRSSRYRRRLESLAPGSVTGQSSFGGRNRPNGLGGGRGSGGHGGGILGMHHISSTGGRSNNSAGNASDGGRSGEQSVAARLLGLSDEGVASLAAAGGRGARSGALLVQLECAMNTVGGTLADEVVGSDDDDEDSDSFEDSDYTSGSEGGTAGKITLRRSQAAAPGFAVTGRPEGDDAASPGRCGWGVVGVRVAPRGLSARQRSLSTASKSPTLSVRRLRTGSAADEGTGQAGSRGAQGAPEDCGGADWAAADDDDGEADVEADAGGRHRKKSSAGGGGAGAATAAAEEDDGGASGDGRDPWDEIYFEVEGLEGLQGPYTAAMVIAWYWKEAPTMRVLAGPGDGTWQPLQDVEPKLRARQWLALTTPSAEADSPATSASVRNGSDPWDWGFDLFRAGGVRAPEDAVGLALRLFVGLRIPRFVSVSEAGVIGFLRGVAHNTGLGVGPPPVPGTLPPPWSDTGRVALANARYHTLYHAVDTLQAIAVGLSRWQAGRLLTAEETAALWAATLTHDVGHPGGTNAYLLATEHPLALRYCDDAPLERHHAARSAELARDAGLWDEVGPESRRRLRALTTRLILSTNMRRHADIIGDLASLTGTLSRVLDAQRSGVAPSATVLASWAAPGAAPGDDTIDVAAKAIAAVEDGLVAAAGGAGAEAGAGAGAVPLAVAPLGSGAEGHDGAHLAAVAQAEALAARLPGATVLAGPSRLRTLAAARSLGGGGSTGDAASAAGAVAVCVPAPARLALACGLLHVADVSGVARSWPIPRMWVTRLLEELWAEGDAEEAAGMPVTSGRQRTTTDPAAFALGIVDYVVAPLLAGLAAALPRSHEAFLSLTSSRRRWEGLRRASAAAAAAPVSDSGSPTHASRRPIAPAPSEGDDAALRRRGAAFEQTLRPLVAAAACSAASREPVHAGTPRARAFCALAEFTAAVATADPSAQGAAVAMDLGTDTSAVIPWPQAQSLSGPPSVADPTEEPDDDWASEQDEPAADAPAPADQEAIDESDPNSAWRSFADEDGDLYFVNQLTGESQWDCPEGFTRDPET